MEIGLWCCASCLSRCSWCWNSLCLCHQFQVIYSFFFESDFLSLLSYSWFLLKLNYTLKLFTVINFLCSWDFIYAEYVMDTGIHYRSIVWQVISSQTLGHALLIMAVNCPSMCPWYEARWFRAICPVPLMINKWWHMACLRPKTWELDFINIGS